MKHLCINCNYIYNEIIGEVEDWIKQWTKLDSIREKFVCPSCFESSENFQEITPYINSLDNWEFLLLIELEHTPKIDFLDSWFIKIEVNHSSEESHFLWNIWIYDEYGELVYEEFFRPWEPAYLEFNISDLDDFEVRTECSLHWVFSKKFER